MGGKKKIKHCMHIKPHKAHTWDHVKQSPQPGAVRTVEKVWCQGIGNHHVHVWDANSYPLMRRPDGKVAALGEPGVPWTGPFECQCGASAWLTGGYKKRDMVTEERFPIGDPLVRIMALKAKLDAGHELSDDDQKELSDLADALIAAFRPIAEALAKLAVQVGEYITAFLDRIDYVKIAELLELSKTYGERPDAVETVTLMGDNLEPQEFVVHGGSPMAAREAVSLNTGATAIVSDEDQAFVRGERISTKVVPDVTVHIDGSMTANTPLGQDLVQPHVEIYPRQSGKSSYLGGR
jgi:hypothetical protein